jgi:hypothetical protein
VQHASGHGGPSPVEHRGRGRRRIFRHMRSESASNVGDGSSQRSGECSSLHRASECRGCPTAGDHSRDRRPNGANRPHRMLARFRRDQLPIAAGSQDGQRRRIMQGAASIRSLHDSGWWRAHIACPIHDPGTGPTLLVRSVSINVPGFSLPPGSAGIPQQSIPNFAKAEASVAAVRLKKPSVILSSSPYFRYTQSALW